MRGAKLRTGLLRDSSALPLCELPPPLAVSSLWSLEFECFHYPNSKDMALPSVREELLCCQLRVNGTLWLSNKGGDDTNQQ